MRRILYLGSTLLLFALVLGGCGGGGGSGAPAGSSGSGSSSGGGSSGGGGSAGTSSNTLTISDANALELLDLVFNDAELLEVNAELLVSGAALLQLSDTNRIDLDCPEPSGTVYLEHNDSDSSGTLSVGDRVVVGLDECQGISVNASLTITALSQSGVSFDELSGRIQFSLTPVAAGSATLVSSQDVQFSVGSSLLEFRSVNGLVSGSGIETSNLIVEKAIAPSIFGYFVSLSGDVDYFGESFEFETTADFSGEFDVYPRQGRLLMTGADSAAQVEADGDPYANYSVDPSGTGQFGTDFVFAWPDIAVGPLFEVSGSDTNDVPPGITDLISRSWNLGGMVADAAVDSARNVIYFSITDRNEVAAVDMDTLLVTDRIYVGSGPRGLWLSDDGNTLYSALSYGGAVSALNLDTSVLDTVVIATEVDSPTITEVVEAAPGIVFATGVGEIGGEFSDLVYVARIDFNQSNAVARVADGRDLATGSRYVSLLVSPDRESVYVGGQQGLFELDATSSDAPVVQEADGVLIESYTYAISPDGSRIYNGDGNVISTANFEVIGETDRGWPHPLASGTSIAQVGTGRRIGGGGSEPTRFEFNFEFYSALTLNFLDRFAIVCDLEQPVAGLLPLPNDGEWLFFGEDGICAVDIFDAANPPGSDADNEPPEPVERISVTSSEIALPSSPIGAVYDSSRGQLYFSIPWEQEILVYSADTLEQVSTYAVTGFPTLMDLAPDANELAMVLWESNELGILDLNTGIFETLSAAPSLDVSVFHEVAYAGSGNVFAIGTVVSEGAENEIIKLARDGSSTPTIVGSGVEGRLQELTDVLDRLFVTVGSPGRLYALDLSLGNAPAILEADADTVAAEGIAVSPNGDSVALRRGQVFRGSDLILSGIIDEGTVAYSGDGSRLAQSLAVGEIHLFDADTLQKTLIVETGCGETASQSMFHLAGYNAWAVVAGLDVCIVPMPGSTMQAKPELQPQTKHSPSEYCDSDCVMRRHVTRRILRLAEFEKQLRN